MESEVQMLPIGELCDFLSGFAFKSEDLKGNSGIPVVKIKNVNNKVVTLEDMQFYPEDKLDSRVSRFLLSDGDVLIAMTGQGSVGRVGRLTKPKGTKLLLNQRVGKFIPKKTVACLDYIYYVISSEKYENILFNAASGSGQPNLSPAIIKAIQIPFIPLKDQIVVSQILTKLDNKITLNRQINQTLEQMAQALFKSWFVDFDPVVDNALDAGFFEQDLEFSDELLRRAETRKKVRESADFKALPENIRQLFPATFEECAEPSLGLGGWVPEGWGTLTLSEISKIASGKRPPTKGALKTKEEPVPVWGGNGIKWFTDRPLSTDRYVITGRVGTLGTVYKVNGPSWASDNALTIRPLRNEYFEFVYQVLSNFDIDSLNSGSTQPLVTQTALGNIQLVFPSNTVLFGQFQKHIDTYDKKTAVNCTEVETLTNLRDTLLPKLISGELRLSHSEVDTADEVLA
ncbi:restriction endonuclease subunit S [Pantoea septica]|uniref:restriction endonuclease subunit S n=1 Tax=Pantoea septica TaxID=472695 RepID=UPI002898ED99|nr:restriction endonuclease subunit S [Pantoea septica]